MNVHTTVAIGIAVFFTTMLGGMMVDTWADVQMAEIEAYAPKYVEETKAYQHCVDNGYDEIRMDLIPYSECMCRDTGECWCHPI